jgi:hypothetical protein
MDRAGDRKPGRAGGAARRQNPQVGFVPQMNNRVLRVILLPDGETVHNAFFDRSFREVGK